MKKTTQWIDWLSQRLNLTEIFSLLTSYGLFYTEVDPRKPIREALAEAMEKPVPSYARWPRVLGLTLVVLVAVEIVTGGLLALYYLPTPESAYASVGTISRDVHFGWFVRQVHYWGAAMLVAVALVRVFRFFVQGVYRPPRELTWVFAVLLLLVCFHLDASGKLLPFSADAYWSTVRALEAVRPVPFYGSFAYFMLGSDSALIGDLPLIRSYFFHIAILPLALVSLIYLHFSTVRKLGLTERTREERRSGPRAFYRHIVNLGILLTLLFGVLVTLAVLVPVPLSGPADPFSTPAQVRPPWHLLASLGFLDWTSQFLPSWFAGTLLFAGFFCFLFWPFFYRPRGDRHRLATLIALVALVLWLLFTVHGMRVA